MTRYELFLFLHVLAAAAWIGAVVFVVFVSELALRAGDRETLLKLLHYDDKVAPFLYVPAFLLVLGAGIALILDGPWSFGDTWVIAGIVLLAAVFVVGAVVVLAAAKKVLAAVDASGIESSDVRDRLRTLRLWSWLDLVLLVAIVWVMTAKP